jgi:hypothetical protein
MIPNKGNSATGKRDVTAKGIISVIHHTAINSATARVYVTFGLSGSILPNRIKETEISGAITRLTIDLVFKILQIS